jgi:hypothetical protein
MPYSLALLVLPLSLHEKTRNIFKARAQSYLTSILRDHPEIQVGLAERAKDLIPYGMEAFAYLSDRALITVTTDGAISVDQKRITKTPKGTADTKSCQTVAKSLGKKFAEAGDRATIYTSLGIRP